MKKYNKVVNILTGLFTIMLFIYMCINFVQIPSNENKELMIKYCDEVAYTFDGGSVEIEGYDVKLSVEREEIIVKVKDITNYTIKAEYPIVNSNFTGTTKSFTIDLDKATYAEGIGNNHPYGTIGKISVVSIDVGMAIVSSLCSGMFFWVFFSVFIGSIIEKIIKKKKDKENNNY